MYHDGQRPRCTLQETVATRPGSRSLTRGALRQRNRNGALLRDSGPSSSCVVACVPRQACCCRKVLAEAHTYKMLIARVSHQRHAHTLAFPSVWNDPAATSEVNPTTHVEQRHDTTEKYKKRLPNAASKLPTVSKKYVSSLLPAIEQRNEKP